MKDKRRRLFSLSANESDYTNEREDKIQFVSCLNGGKNCTEHRSLINQKYRESNIYLRGKDYHQSIDALKIAFEKTHELDGITCKACSDFFRQTIIQSMEEIQNDLSRMNKGWFKTDRYEASYEFVTQTLEDMRKKI